jgi:hypothetical protein
MPKIKELLRAGNKYEVKDVDQRTTLEWTNSEVKVVYCQLHFSKGQIIHKMVLWWSRGWRFGRMKKSSGRCMLARPRWSNNPH